MEINFTINITQFNDKAVKSFDGVTIEELLNKLEPNHKTWVHFNSIVDVNGINQVFSRFGIPEYFFSDIIDQTKFEKHETVSDIFFVKFLVKLDSSVNANIKDEHVSFVIGKDFIVTIEEKGFGLFNSIRERLKNGKSNALGKSTGYLFYKMLKLCVVDKYFDFFAKFIELHEKAEEEVLSRYSKRTLSRILNLRKQILPFREYLIELDNINDIIIAEESLLLDMPDQRSLKESIIRRVKDLKETLTDLRRWNTELMEIYRANVGEKMERVMRTLTIFSSIFLPLTVITGFYGMNFVYIPLLESVNGWLIISGAMLLISVSMLIYMKWRKWY
jgi:magnesium transporter